MTTDTMTISAYCRYAGISRKQFYHHKKTGAIGPDCFTVKPGGKTPKVIPGKADKALARNVRHSSGGSATKQKNNPDAPKIEPVPETEQEVQNYLDESIGDLSILPITELQRRNELEKLLLAQIKRRRESEELLEAAEVERLGFEAAREIRDSIQAIPARISALIAAESEAFQVKQIMDKEIYHVLTNLSEKLANIGK